ncbi:putative spok spore killer [Podospora aff. communis PSN243]|uniref:Spok spore killer n=1 Tax=Podospora aff. communis PSN243 TaxID=3040156 RepID=A0AAV9FY09_9PEZI|nr:putative spok spore killer [Podospora aff. communis PSN243]
MADNEIARLRQALAEQQRLREAAEHRALDEQRRREEEQRRREEEQRRREEEQRRREEEQRRREEEQRRREEEQRRREEEQRRREEEQRRREDAEEVAKTSRPQTLAPYLEACHDLNLAIKVVTDRSLTTQGDATNPVGRVYPQRIIPWNDFPASQQNIWDQLSEPSFMSQPMFPSQHQLDYVRSLISPISSENGLRSFEREVVEHAVQKLVSSVYENTVLRDRLSLRGVVTFESHTNLGATDDSLSRQLEHAGQPTTAARNPRRPMKGKGGQADNFCIYRTSNGENIPAMAIEYKAPHKLTQDEVITGLGSEIQPERDVINKKDEDFTFAAKMLTAAVVTQLFSYMIAKGLQYGYICTGETFVFLHIPEDPTIVYYHVCVPNLDVISDDEDRLHRTAVAQVFAFILQALRTPPPPLSWHDAAADLGIWAVEYDEVLSKIPPSVRKDKQRASPYKPQRWRGFKRSPIRTRSLCQQPETKPPAQDDDNEEEDAPPSRTRYRSTRSGMKDIDTGKRSSRNKGQHGRGGQQGNKARKRIQDQPYCTQQCLLGLAYSQPVDKSCPNARSHGLNHIECQKFLHLLRAQLAEDRGPDADSTPLYVSGAIGSLFKVRLSVCGYTLVAKGVEEVNVTHLQHEKAVYDQLRTLQGKHIPVCLGLIDLVLPHYHDGRVLKHFLLLSWAGQTLSKCIGQINKKFATFATMTAFTRLHQLHILHGDAEPRNILYDAVNRSVMIADFERAQFRGSQPLSPIRPGGQCRSREGALRKQRRKQQRRTDDFISELRSAVEKVSNCFDNMATGGHPTKFRSQKIGDGVLKQ